METKQKTWEDCLDEVALKDDHKDFETAKYRVSHDDLMILIKQAAELFNSSTAEERDELKEKLKIAIDGISDLEKEYRKTEAELNSYSRIAHQLKEENERLKEELIELRNGIQIQEAIGDRTKKINELMIIVETANTMLCCLMTEQEIKLWKDWRSWGRISEWREQALAQIELFQKQYSSLISKASDGYTKAKE